MVCRLKKTLCGLKKAPRAWYARLDKYLLKQNFKKGTANSNIYFKVEGIKLLIVVIYVYDIIFGGSDSLCKEFSLQKKCRKN